MKTKKDKLAWAVLGLGALTYAIDKKGYEVKIVKKPQNTGNPGKITK